MINTAVAQPPVGRKTVTLGGNKYCFPRGISSSPKFHHHANDFGLSAPVSLLLLVLHVRGMFAREGCRSGTWDCLVLTSLHLFVSHIGQEMVLQVSWLRGLCVLLHLWSGSCNNNDLNLLSDSMCKKGYNFFGNILLYQIFHTKLFCGQNL